MRLPLYVLLFVFSLSLVAADYAPPRDGFSVSDRVVVVDTAVYSTGYMSVNGSSWSLFSLQGDSIGSWVVGEAVSASVPDDARYFAVFSCTWEGSWDCSDTWQVLDRGERESDTDYVSKDSLQEDFEALQALYASTQGQFLEVLASESELPAYEDADYPPLYMVEGDVFAPSFTRHNDFDGWYNAGPVWKDTTGWVDMTPQTMGDAVGVEVDADGRVVILDMQKVIMDGENTLGNGLAGVLPQEIGNLKRLVHLNLKQNFFHGPIPSELGLLTNLERLSLGGQHGEIDIDRPKDWNEPNHRGIYQPGGKRYEESNMFYGPIPPELGNLVNLEFLEIRRQYVTGTLPLELGNIAGLEAFMIGGSKAPVEVKLHGPIPPEYGAWNELKIFHVAGYTGDEQISGEFPQEVVDGWENIANLNVAGNRLSGEIPEFLNSRNKKYMHFAGNNFTGGFPAGYFNGDNSGISALKIRDNRLTGPLPEELPKPTYPRPREGYPTGTMRYDNNKFSGPVPSWVREAPVIQYQLNANEFSGSFPLNDNDRMRLFWIHGNEFSGELPDANWSSSALYSILIGGNNFSGSIPDSWLSMVTEQTDLETGEYTGRLWRFEAQNNELSGLIPAWFADVSTMTRFKVYNNRFVFRDILPHYDEILASMQQEAAREGSRDSSANYEFAPQKPFGKVRGIEVASGDSFTVDFSDEVGYEGNEYVWLLDDEVVAETADPVLSISDVSSSDAGVYVLRVRNPALEELTLFSKEVTVSVS